VFAIVDRPDAAEAATLAPELRTQIDELASERAWAGEVCGALSTWREELGRALDDLQGAVDLTDPAATLDALSGAFDRTSDATERLVADLRATGAPDSTAGRALADGIDELARDVGRRLERIGLRLTVIGGDVDVGDSFGLPGLVRELRGLYDDVRADLDALREPARELLDVLRANPDCQPFLAYLQLD